jgi:FKBP-type peptidyl-prolyl cis-trans isomerase
MNTTNFTQKMKEPIFKKHVLTSIAYMIFSILVLTLGVNYINDQTSHTQAITMKEQRAQEASASAGKAKTDARANAQKIVDTARPELKIVTVQDSQGEAVALGDNAKVHYTGKLEDGTKFDSSYDRNEPFVVENVGAAQVIQGWNASLVGMKKGAKYSVTIPSKYAYGEQGSEPKIKPNATLIFDIEIVDIDKINNPYKN